MNAKRVQRIWRREGLKVPQKQPKRGRLWLNDGSCIRLGPCWEVLSKVDGAVKSCWPMACLYRSLRFGEEYLPVSALLVDKT